MATIFPVIRRMIPSLFCAANHFGVKTGLVNAVPVKDLECSPISETSAATDENICRSALLIMARTLFHQKENEFGDKMMLMSGVKGYSYTDKILRIRSYHGKSIHAKLYGGDKVYELHFDIENGQLMFHGMWVAELFTNLKNADSLCFRINKVHSKRDNSEAELALTATSQEEATFLKKYWISTKSTDHPSFWKYEYRTHVQLTSPDYSTSYFSDVAYALVLVQVDKLIALVDHLRIGSQTRTIYVEELELGLDQLLGKKAKIYFDGKTNLCDGIGVLFEKDRRTMRDHPYYMSYVGTPAVLTLK